MMSGCGGDHSVTRIIEKKFFSLCSSVALDIVYICYTVNFFFLSPFFFLHQFM